MGLVNEIPLGRRKMEISLQLRQAMLLNGMLFNSESWHSLTMEEIKRLEAVNEHLLRSIVKGHSKAPLEFLYLEVAALPIRYIISCRRLLYLQTLLTRGDKEITKQVYLTQKKNPTKGDFYELIPQTLKKMV